MDDDKSKRKPKEEVEKRCIGMCNKEFVKKDGKPEIYCSSCDRYLLKQKRNVKTFEEFNIKNDIS